jgi:hypothetical protein
MLYSGEDGALEVTHDIPQGGDRPVDQSDQRDNQL